MSRCRSFVIAAAVLAAASCGSTAATETSGQPTPTGPVDLSRAVSQPPKTGGQLNYGLTAETNNFDPHKGQWGMSGYAVANAIFDPLAATDKAGVAQPYLAESIAPNDDFTMWTIKVRSGITFHDGSPLDAAVVADNLKAAKASPLMGPALEPITSVDAFDARTVTVRLSTPWSTFPAHLAGQAGYIAASATMASADGGSKPIGTGPFAFKDWTRDAELTAVRNPTYWRQGLPYLDQIHFQVVTDPHSRLQSIQSGSLDAGVWSSPYKDVQRAAEAGELQMYTDAGAETAEIFLTLNTSVAPFDDPVAREALDLVVDRSELAQTVFDDLYAPAAGPINPDSPLHRGDKEAPGPDVAKARQLAEDYKARHGAPLSFKLISTPVTEYQAAVQAVQAQAAAAGITIEIETQVQSALIASVLSGKYQASGFFFFGNQHFDLEHPYLAAKPAEAGQLSLNFSRFDDPELRAAMNEARATDDRDKQAEAYQRVRARLRASHAFVFLVHARTAFASANSVHGANRTTLPDGQPALVSTAPFPAEIWKS